MAFFCLEISVILRDRINDLLVANNKLEVEVNRLKLLNEQEQWTKNVRKPQ